MGFDACAKEISDWWQVDLDNFIDAIQEMLEISVLCPDCCASPSLKHAIENEWRDYCAVNMHQFRKECDEFLLKENKFGTANHYLTSKYQKEMVIPESVKDEFRESITESTFKTNDWTSKGYVA